MDVKAEAAAEDVVEVGPLRGPLGEELMRGRRSDLEIHSRVVSDIPRKGI